MIQTPPEVRIANWLFILFWIVIVLVLWLFGGRWQASRAFRERMIAGWKPSLSIALIFAVSMGIAGRGWVNPYAVAIFCQALLGLALARGIPNHDPLPVVRSVIQRDRLLRAIGLTLGMALAAFALEFVVGNIGMGIIQQIVGETTKTEEAMESFVPNALQAFFSAAGGCRHRRGDDVSAGLYTLDLAAVWAQVARYHRFRDDLWRLPSFSVGWDVPHLLAIPHFPVRRNCPDRIDLGVCICQTGI